MFIPQKIRVGFQKRSDTFTEKLAYIIYYDEKGKIRKEDSWNSWRDQSIEVLELDNTPQNGYLFNKGVQRSGHWGSGRSVIRVYDPRDFEFEISVDNLIGILMHSDVSKRDIVEQCVLAWSGKDLILLPTNSEEYIQSLAYTAKQDQKISTKELKPGFWYEAKKSDEKFMYVGHYNWYDWTDIEGYDRAHILKGKKHIFFNGRDYEIKGVNTLSHEIEDSYDKKFPSICEKFYSTINSQPITNVVIKQAKIKQRHFYHLKNSKITVFNLGWHDNYLNEHYTEDLSFAPSLHKKNQQRVHTSYYYSNNKVEYSPQFKELKNVKLNKEPNGANMEELFKHGIGNMYYVLENGKEVDIEANRSYYY